MAECLHGTPVAPPGPPYEALGSGRVTGGESGRRGGEIPPPLRWWYLRVQVWSGPRPNPHQIIRQITKGPQAGPIIWKIKSESASQSITLSRRYIKPNT